jgi:hypothetical protein
MVKLNRLLVSALVLLLEYDSRNRNNRGRTPQVLLVQTTARGRVPYLLYIKQLRRWCGIYRPDLLQVKATGTNCVQAIRHATELPYVRAEAEAEIESNSLGHQTCSSQRVRKI